MVGIRLGAMASLALGCAALGAGHSVAADDVAVAKIETIVVVYAENRAFDNLYGHFPSANGLQNVTPDMARQLDRDGSPLKELPPVWGGLTAPGVKPAISEAQSAHLPNAPFAIDDPKGFNLPMTVTTHDLWHRFYQNQMQINYGKNDGFVAWADSGGLVMGHYDGSKLPLWTVAQRYVCSLTTSSWAQTGLTVRQRGHDRITT